MIPVILMALAFSFVGDALRDALDPYSFTPRSEPGATMSAGPGVRG